MDFYTSIHPWYDQIFPYQEGQRTFVLRQGSDPAWTLVDAGCGTGSLILNLHRDFGKVIGMDPDAAMLQAAREKALKTGTTLELRESGMLDLAAELSVSSVDRLVCFGNTLPHLADEEEVAEFARQAARVLRPGGRMMLQVINYDRILDQHLAGLPTIENDQIRFERKYLYSENPTHVGFRTQLTIKSTGQTIVNEVPLLAIRPYKIRKILEDQGFSDFNEFGTFSGEPFTASSQPYILVTSH
jgi:2-polyprenyl-3-methyl-5-hydroxy-6-metoxy-1,4-benzoquinol methylase